MFGIQQLVTYFLDMGKKFCKDQNRTSMDGKKDQNNHPEDTG